MKRSILITAAIAGLVACGTNTPVDSPAPELTVTSAETLTVDTDTPDAPEALPGAAIEVATNEPAVEEPAFIEVETTNSLTFYTLRRGETLAHFARWSELPVEEIAQTSDLELDGMYAVGTELALAIDPEIRSQIESRRDAHHRTRAEAYLASRGSNGTEFYSVKTGDSAWTIARDRHGMPVWLLESLNPSAKLDTLRPGDELLVPVFNDIVAEAPSDPEPTSVPDSPSDAPEAPPVFEDLVVE